MTNPQPPMPTPLVPKSKGTPVVTILLICFGVLVLIVVGVGAVIYTGAKNARQFVRKAQTKAMIDNMGMALEAYKTEFGTYPPGGYDANDDGNLDDTDDDLGCGKDYFGGDVAQLQLRTICTTLDVRNSQGEVVRTLSPYYNPNKLNIRVGQILDIFDNPLRYLDDGRRTMMDPQTGEPFPGRVWERKCVLWSVGKDGKQDPQNNNVDDDSNDKVDDEGELEDDICSWN